MEKENDSKEELNEALETRENVTEEDNNKDEISSKAELTESEESKVKKEKDKEQSSKKKKINKKFVFLVMMFVLVVVFLLFVLFVLLGKKPNEEEMNENFKIRSVTAKSKGDYISNNETFILKTTTANEEIVRSHLYIEPPVNYEIKKVKSDEYEVAVADIPSDTLVNLSLVKDQVKSYSWAFQTTKDLKVVDVYPTNGASTVSTNTGINIVFSYPNVENIEEHFNISPKVEGTFSHIGRTWTFRPSAELANNTTYTITISAGVKAGDYELEESYKSTFSTYNRPSVVKPEEARYYKHSSITYDSISTFTVGEKVTFKMYYINGDYEVDKIKMFKFASYNDFIKYLNNENDYNVTDLGYKPFTRIEKYFSYVLNDTLDEGYYVEEVYLTNGEKYASIPVQINKLSAFMFASDEELLLWVGSDNKLLKDIKVTYNNNSVTTDENGIATIKKYNDSTSKLRYLFVGDGANPLVIGITGREYNDYPSGYIYVDRPLYKNTDVVNIWGYVPLKFYSDLYDDFSKQKFVLSLENESIPIKINDDGTFIAKYNIDNYQDQYMDLSLKYNNTIVASRYFEIKNYKKMNYDYSVVMDKNYVKAGDTFKFAVQVNHVTGVTVQNKSIVVIYDGKTYTSVTDSSGKAYFSIPTTNNNYGYSISSDYVSVKTGGSEYNENDFSFTFYKLNYLANVTDSNYDYKNQNVKFHVVNLTTNKDVDFVDYYDIDEKLKESDYNGNVKVELVETHYNRVVDYVYYNSFTQKNVNVYKYVKEYEKVVENNEINISNGNAEYNIKYQMKTSGENDSYQYELRFHILRNGVDFVYKIYPFNYSGDYNYQQYGHYSDELFYTGVYSDDYYYYRYYLESGNKNKYSVGDDIILNLKSFDDSQINDGKILRLLFKNTILDKKLFNYNDDLNTVFESSSIPGVGYTGALFLNGKFYRLPANYYDYDESNSKLDVEITTDKDKYNPGEEVILKIKAKDSSGDGTKAKINVSVVDKAVFNLEADITNILEGVYSDIYYRAYTYSSYRDFEMGVAKGGAGDTGGYGRKKFGDTVYFGEVETDENGEATVKFKLNDSVTSFVVTAHAANKDVSLGVNKKEIVSSIPLAISALEPSDLKTSDDVVISANTVGETTGDVNYVFTLVGTDKKIEKTAKVGMNVYANFGKLAEGEYTVNIAAVSGNEKDSIEVKFSVKTSQQEISVKAVSSINNLKDITPTKNPIILEFYKSGFSKYIKYLDIINNTNEDRLDTKVAYLKALEYENKYYGYNYPISPSDMEKFNNNGVLRYLENETESYVVTALVSYYYPGLYNLDSSIFYERLGKTDSAEEALNQLLVLSAMKKPVLDELKYMNTIIDLSNLNNKSKLALAYAFLGDYDNARKLYNELDHHFNFELNSELNGYIALLSTFVDKKYSDKYIDTIYENDYSNRYLYFAILSYFENNEADLNKESTIKVSYGDHKEEIKIKGLMVKKITINNKDLNTLKISSTDKTDMINYYYEGGFEEINEDNIKKNINISLSNNDLHVGQIVNLRVNISNLPVSGKLKVYLPNSMRLSGIVSGNGIYMSSNKGEYLVIYVSNNHDSYFDIPVYLTYPGNYKIEEVILKVNEDYYISNPLEINIK